MLAPIRDPVVGQDAIKQRSLHFVPDFALATSLLSHVRKLKNMTYVFRCPA